MNPQLRFTRWSDKTKFEDMVGKTFSEVYQGDMYGGDAVYFVVDDNEAYVMYYEPDCCAGCDIEDIAGDLQDLVGEPITTAREDSNSDDPAPSHAMHTYGDTTYGPESYTWTFYNIATRKGHVTIRWYGESNGYYSERASFYRLFTMQKES